MNKIHFQLFLSTGRRAGGRAGRRAGRQAGRQTKFEISMLIVDQNIQPFALFSKGTASLKQSNAINLFQGCFLENEILQSPVISD